MRTYFGMYVFNFFKHCRLALCTVHNLRGEPRSGECFHAFVKCAQINRHAIETASNSLYIIVPAYWSSQVRLSQQMGNLCKEQIVLLKYLTLLKNASDIITYLSSVHHCLDHIFCIGMHIFQQADTYTMCISNIRDCRIHSLSGINVNF